jgi:opacity protein-like surface antigen
MKRLVRPGYFLCITFTILAYTHAAVAHAEDDAISPSTDSNKEAMARPMEQKRRRAPFGVGVRTGMTLARYVGDEASSEIAEHTDKLFIAVGISGVVGLYEWLSLQPELLFVSKGRRDSMGGVLIATFHNDYVEIPLLARITIPVTEQITPYLLAGPAFGLLLRFQLESEIDGAITDRTDEAKRLDLSGIVGAGIQVALTRQHGLTLEGRYDRSFTRFLKSEDDVKNSAFAFMLGYQYSFSSASP